LGKIGIVGFPFPSPSWKAFLMAWFCKNVRKILRRPMGYGGHHS